MIFYNEKTGDWKFYALKATYTDSSKDEPEFRVEYVDNRRFVEERVRQWGHLSDLRIVELEPTPDQVARLNDINNANVENIQEVYVKQYVHYGFIDAPVDVNGVPIDTGSSYLNTIIGRPENDQKKMAYDRLNLRDVVAYTRWKKEIAGININGLYIGTTDREKALLASKVVAAMLEPNAIHRYKTGQGWIELSSENMKQIGMTVQNYVQNCFNRESELVDAINVATDLSTVDYTTGWPVLDYTLDLTPPA